MSADISTQYAQLNDEQLLQLAGDRASLTDDAASVLDAELSRRGLTNSDRAKHERFVKQSNRLESKKRLRRVFGRKEDTDSWGDTLGMIFWSMLLIAIILFAYAALPDRYRFPPIWQEAAVNVMFPSVFLAVVSGDWRRKIAFWVSLLLSSSIHLFVVHAWILRFGPLDGLGHHGLGRLAVLLGIVLFFVVYGCGWQLRRMFYGSEPTEE
jgi:hypothetical protein